jgi:hypothetical protein
MRLKATVTDQNAYLNLLSKGAVAKDVDLSENMQRSKLLTLTNMELHNN